MAGRGRADRRRQPLPDAAAWWCYPSPRPALRWSRCSPLPTPGTNLYALVFVYSADTKTFTSGLWAHGDTFIWAIVSSVIAILPIFIIYVVAQRYIVEGLSAGGVRADPLASTRERTIEDVTLAA